MAPRLERVDAELVEAIARRVVDLIREPAPPSEPADWIDTAEVARRLGVHPATVYRNPRRFGGEKISDGPKGRWRFDPEKIRGEGSSDGDSERPLRRRRRRTKASEGALKVRGTRP